MSDYPEHEKLEAVQGDSQAIGAFLVFGLPRLGLVLYEEQPYDCECWYCKRQRAARSHFHTEEELATVKDGRVQYRGWFPTSRSIGSILSEYFGIDQKKIDAEKEAMLEAFRQAATS